MENQPSGGGPAPERPAPEKPTAERPDAQRPRPGSTWFFLVLAVLMLASMLYYSSEGSKRVEISYGKFIEELKAGHVAEVSVSNQRISGKLKPGIPLPEEKKSEKAEGKQPAGKEPAAKQPAAKEPAGKPPAAAGKKAEQGKPAEGAEFFAVIPEKADENLDSWLLEHLGANYKAVEDTSGYGLMLLVYLTPLALVVVMWLMFRRARDQFLGGGILSGFNKSPAKRYETGKQRITFEYILIEEVNDSDKQARELAKHAHALDAKLNLIPYNNVEGLDWVRPSPDRQKRFLAVLRAAGVRATLRREKGDDIAAACGQLRLQTERAVMSA